MNLQDAQHRLGLTQLPGAESELMDAYRRRVSVLQMRVLNASRVDKSQLLDDLNCLEEAHIIVLEEVQRRVATSFTRPPSAMAPGKANPPVQPRPYAAKPAPSQAPASPYTSTVRRKPDFLKAFLGGAGSILSAVRALGSGSANAGINVFTALLLFVRMILRSFAYLIGVTSKGSAAVTVALFRGLVAVIRGFGAVLLGIGKILIAVIKGLFRLLQFLWKILQALCDTVILYPAQTMSFVLLVSVVSGVSVGLWWFSMQPAEVRFESWPASRVYVNGTFVGEAPSAQVHELPNGEQEIRFEPRNFGAPHVFRATLAPRAVYIIKFSQKKKQHTIEKE